MSNYLSINFVKQSVDNKSDDKVNELDGNEVKEFYENLISTSDPMTEKIKSELKSNSVKSCVKSRQKTKSIQLNTNNSIKLQSIFKFCQNGDLEECRQWIQMGFDVNTRDQYLWTPLMCSSCAGHQNIVNLLLRNNADIEPKDRNGRTALDLALINGHKDICHLIINHKNTNNLCEKSEKTFDSKVSEETDVYKRKGCDVCQTQYNGSDSRHLCSIVHQIHCKNDPKFNKYFTICESNKGFQMMLKNGWNKEEGLGPNGSGVKGPIKTVLKRDRLGLGLVHKKPKVTHFCPFDEKSVKHIVRQSKSSKESRRKRLENRLKRIEIKFRQEFK